MVSGFMDTVGLVRLTCGFVVMGVGRLRFASGSLAIVQHTHRHAHTDTHTHAVRHTCTHARTHTHTQHTHTHTHIHSDTDQETVAYPTLASILARTCTFPALSHLSLHASFPHADGRKGANRWGERRSNRAMKETKQAGKEDKRGEKKRAEAPGGEGGEGGQNEGGKGRGGAQQRGPRRGGGRARGGRGDKGKVWRREPVDCS
jgi:hypothetical protein